MNRTPNTEKEVIVPPASKSARLIKFNEQRAGADEISPELRAMLVTIRAALLMAADAIANYLGLEKRRRDFD
jgi:hypothetical protein